MSLSENNSLPELLSQVNQLPYDYADGDGIDFEPYDVFLSVNETSHWFRAWTGNSDADASKFRVFGQDGTGGYVAFWTVRNTSDLLAQPIVFMGSEGETAVLARNFYDYLWLLADQRKKLNRMRDNLEKLRQWIVVVCFTFTASIFWAVVSAGLARYFFRVSEELSLLAIGLPVGLGMGIYLLPKMRRHQFR